VKRFSVLKKALPFALATTLISPLYPAKENKANAIELISIGYSFLDKQTQTTSSNNSNLYKQKKQEFKPPELPYCRIKRADWEGVVIDYYPEDYNKTEKAYTLRWAVNNINWYTIGGARVDYVYTSGYNVELGSYDKAFIQDCLIRASRKVLANSGTTAGSYSPYELVIKRVKGNVFGNCYVRFGEPQ
jgi:hypothetical protein